MINKVFKKFVLLLGFFSFVTLLAFGQDQEIEKFIGTWMSDGRVEFTIKAQGEFIALEAPASPKVTTEFKNVQVKDGKLTFEKIFSRKDGTPSPYGDHYYFEIREDSDGIMMQRLSSTPSFEQASDHVLVKESDYPSLPNIEEIKKSKLQNASKQDNAINIMEVVLFLNANQSNNGYATFKADHDKKNLRYFDKNGKVFEESYIDENNDIVTKKYDQNGNVISESKITQAFIEESINNESDYDRETKRVAKVALNKLAIAAENYKATHAGLYPNDARELQEKTPDLEKDYCNEGMKFYKIICEFRGDGYTLTARPRYFDMNPGNLTYRMTTGKVLEEIDPGKR